MSESPDAVLLQQVYNCGSYEAGHKLIVGHASDVSADFVATLQAESMKLLDGESPELAPVFADLAVVAAVALGADQQKGHALYCKGVVLGRLKEYSEALDALFDAQEYLRTAGARGLLANCLFDAAKCYADTGQNDVAIRLLEESLLYQTEEKNRVDTRAFILVLEEKSGNLTTIQDVEALLTRFQATDRCFVVREASDAAERRDICARLLHCNLGFSGNPLFKASVAHFLERPEYRFFVASDVENSSTPYACGILKPYQDAFNDRALLGLEAVTFSDLDGSSHVRCLSALATFCARFDVCALCVSQRSVGSSTIARVLLRGCGVADWPSVLVQGVDPGLYSAFAESPDPTPSFAHCIMLRVDAEGWDFGGVVATREALLYRGEGRASYASRRQVWDLRDGSDEGYLERLARHFFSEGFRARAEESFAGTVHAQLLHQGYVPQPTVSLSACEKVCAYYATEKHQRSAGGVVFVIDAAKLARQGRLFDSFETLKKHNSWLRGAFYPVIKKVISALNGKRDDVRRSGAFLQMCHLESRRRVEAFGGGSLGSPVDWSARLGSRWLAELEGAGVSRQMLDSINAEFEAFWNIALGQMQYMDKIDAASGTSETVGLSRAYFRAFDDVRLKLKEAWMLNKGSLHNHPGWDISPLGYVTKTIRDEEFFSDGDIPGDRIVEARIVDQWGKRTSEIQNIARQA